jgi:hypothetical protein
VRPNLEWQIAKVQLAILPKKDSRKIERLIN